MAPPLDPRQRIRADIEKVVGRLDEAEVYDGPAGDPGLVAGLKPRASVSSDLAVPAEV